MRPITYYDGSRVNGEFNTIGGSSGSPLINVGTGKLVGVAVTGGMILEPSTAQGCGGLWDLCFDCGGTTGSQATIAPAPFIPPIGLQVDSEIEVDHYGPPTGPEDFPGQVVNLSVPQGSRTVDWSVSQDGEVFQVLDVWEGPTYGTLAAGDSETLVIGPLADYLHNPGTYGATLSYYDSEYSTKTPVLHRVHVGRDGFTAVPEEALDGPDGLGVPHGAEQTYHLANRWIVSQPLSVSAYDPDDPQQAWPSWLELNGGTDPFPLILPAPGGGKPPPADLVVDGTDLAPGTYRGRIVFSSDDSGYPPFEDEREVYFDHCREVFADPELPMPFSLGAGQELVRSITVAPTGGSTVADVDLIAGLGAQIIGNDRPFEVHLKSPNEPFVVLKDEDDLGQNVYDDETNPLVPPHSMEAFDGHWSPGPWKLKIVNRTGGTWNFTLFRFEIRLHHDGAPPCVTTPPDP